MTYMSLILSPDDGELAKLNALAAQGWTVVTISSSGAMIWVLLGRTNG